MTPIALKQETKGKKHFHQTTTKHLDDAQDFWEKRL